MNDQEQKCKCDFRIRMLGDGCRYCQPQEYIDRLHDTMDKMIHPIWFALTDEEILREWVDATYLDASQCTDDIKDFARAILRKAQEK